MLGQVLEFSLMHPIRNVAVAVDVDSAVIFDVPEAILMIDDSHMPVVGKVYDGVHIVLFVTACHPCE